MVSMKKTSLNILYTFTYTTFSAHEASAELRDEAESIKRKICQLEEENSKICNQCMKVKNGNL